MKFRICFIIGMAGRLSAGLSGIDLTHKLVQTGHSIPVIFITAFPQDRIRAQATAPGAICCLVKPYRDDELLGCIGLALGTAQDDCGSSQEQSQC